MPEEENSRPVEAQEAELVSALEPVYCRWCGVVGDEINALDNPDWRCLNCDRYQDAMPCPTCGSNVRISLMKADLRPAVAKPKKSKGDG